VRALLVFLFLLTAAILQATVGPVVGVLGVIPDIVLVLVVCHALLDGSEAGMLWGLLGGFSLDMLSGSPTGTHMLALIVVGFLAGLAKASPFRSRFLVPLLAIAAATSGYDAVIALVLRATGWPISLSLDLARVIAPSVITNGVLMPFVYYVLSQIAAMRGGLRPEF
jgi:rod shape-determining protein MreD